jgi:hypothetical protein
MPSHALELSHVVSRCSRRTFLLTRGWYRDGSKETIRMSKEDLLAHLEAGTAPKGFRFYVRRVGENCGYRL